MGKITSFRQILVILVITVGLMFSAETSKACSCIVSPTVNVAFQKTPNVVVLRVDSFEKYPEGTKDFTGSPIKQSKLVVEKVFKGNLKVGQVLTFEQGVCCICVWGFSEESIGQTYLFYLPARPDNNGVWKGSTCSRSGSIKDVAADLLYLEKIFKVRGKTRLSGLVKQHIQTTLEEEFSYNKPLPGKTLHLVGMGKDLKLKTDVNGVYEIYDLPAGKYKIMPEKIEGYKIWDKDGSLEVEIKANSHTEADFTYQINNGISGRFLDTTGKPLKNVCLKLISATENKLPENYSTDCTDASGNFLIGEIPVGTYFIVVNDDGEITAEEPFGTFYYPDALQIKDAAKITIGAGDFYNELVITAPETAEIVTVSGSVSFEKGRAPTKENYKYVSVLFVAEKSPINPRNEKKNNDSRVEVDENGDFTIRILKGQKGRLYAELLGFVGEYDNCPKLDNLLRAPEANMRARSSSIEIEAVNDINGVDFRFPFPSCKKTKIE